jgi:hypothetical protein
LGPDSASAAPAAAGKLGEFFSLCKGDILMLLRRKFLMGLAAICVMVALSPQVKADFGPETPPTISWSDLTTAGYTAFNTQLQSSFTYTGGPTPSGNAVSQVYSITQGGVTTYAYLYQLQPVSGSDVAQFQTYWHNSAFASSPVAVGSNAAGPVYDITSGAAPTASSDFNVTGSLATSPSITGTDFDRVQGQWRLTTGANTPIIVVFSNIAPGVELVHNIQDGSGLASSGFPNVYAPAPEPPAVALCGIGILGLFGAAAFRRFARAVRWQML